MNLNKDIEKSIKHIEERIKYSDVRPEIVCNKEDIDNVKQEIPLERIGKTRDIFKCIEWLIEDNYTTGQIISINGGWNI